MSEGNQDLSRKSVIQKFSSEMCPGDFMQKVNFAYVLRYIYLY